MMKRPSLCLTRCRCPPGTGVTPICAQWNGSPDSADTVAVPWLKAAATGGKSQAIGRNLELRWPYVRQVDHTLGALSP
jgi:hypothetical protein